MTAQLSVLGHAIGVVGVVTGSRDLTLVHDLLAELEPQAVAVVVWATDFVPLPLDFVSPGSGFNLRFAEDGASLQPGTLDVIPCYSSGWFEGQSLRVGPRAADPSSSVDHFLASLAAAWGPLSVALVPGLRDGSKGLGNVVAAQGTALGPASFSLLREAVGHGKGWSGGANHGADWQPIRDYRARFERLRPPAVAESSVQWIGATGAMHELEQPRSVHVSAEPGTSSDVSAFELEVSTVLAAALDLGAIGPGFTQAFTEATAADSVEFWLLELRDGTAEFRRQFPTESQHYGLPSRWHGRVPESAQPVYRAAVSYESVPSAPLPARPVSDRSPSDRRLSDRRLSDRILSERGLLDRSLSERGLAERRLSDRRLSDRSQAPRTPMRRALPARSSSSRGGTLPRSPEPELSAVREQQAELIVPVIRQGRSVAFVRLCGPALRAPDADLSAGLQRIARMVGDFLERLRILQALRQSEASYRQKSAEFEALYASLPVGVSIHDRDGRIRRVNRHLAELEPSLVEEPGANALLRRLYSDAVPGWIERVLETGEAIRGLELAAAEGGEMQSWLCNIAAIRDSEGTILGASTVVQDITQQKRVEASLREADRQKDDFLAMLGHELRNPIAAIRNATELLGQIENPSAQLLRLHSIFDRQVSQTTKLIDGLLDVARVARGKVELQVAPLELGQLVRQIVDDRRHQLLGRVVRTQLSEAEVWVLADRVRMVQVLDNLLSNAIKFTEEHGHIEIHVACAGGLGTCRVVDDGMGIEAELLPNIFDPFRQGRGPLMQALGGLGLGLALVKGLVDLHGFRLRVSSEGPGRGAAFELEFPYTAAPEKRPPESRREVRAMQLLVVEDNLDFAETLSELLTSAGHQVHVVPSAEAALIALREHQPDVVLCDIGLPGMDGLTLANRIRSDAELQDLKLVAMTGYGDAPTRGRIERAEFDRYLTKPVHLDALQQCLARLAAAPPRRAERR